MTEILTESFCERCGTRYTFESAGPRRSPLGRVRTVSKGLRNFVLSDGSTLSEAMADARSEEEINATGHQLDAFHKTFNFCLTCRQYTCGNCWNDVDGRCLTCVPTPESEALAVAAMALAAAEPVAEPLVAEPLVAIAAVEVAEEAWPVVDLDRRTAPPIEAAAEPEPEPEAEAAVAAEPEAGIAVEPVAMVESEAATEPDVPLLAEAAVAAAPEPEVIAAPEPETVVEPDVPLVARAVEPVVLGAVAGQSIEEAIAAYEARNAVIEPDAVADAPAAVEPDAPAAVEAADVSTPEPPPPPPAWEQPAPAAPQRVDVIEQPAWPVAAEPVATEPAAEPVATQPVVTAPPAPATLPLAPEPVAEAVTPVSPWLTVAPDDGGRAEPQWPQTPIWDRSPSRPDYPGTLAGRPLVPQGDASALWAASAREVLTGGARPAQLPAAAPAPTAQPCVNCGLPLSANARFCRRCGNRQG